MFGLVLREMACTQIRYTYLHNPDWNFWEQLVPNQEGPDPDREPTPGLESGGGV